MWYVLFWYVILVYNLNNSNIYTTKRDVHFSFFEWTIKVNDESKSKMVWIWEREITFQFVKRQLMDGKINYGVYHEHVMDLYEFKQPEKLLSDLTDSSATE